MKIYSYVSPESFNSYLDLWSICNYIIFICSKIIILFWKLYLE